MKTKEELNELKAEVEILRRKLGELTEDELSQVFGGFIPPLPRSCSTEGESVFHGTGDGNRKIVDLNIDLGPEGYDCSGLIN